MVSIIVPAYNCESYIEQCLDSLFQQNETAIEVIVVDDGSKDHTAHILDEYAKKDERLKVFHVKNGGPSRARNIGLDHAVGDWILFVDADDWVDADILSRLELSNKAADVIFFGFKRSYDDVRMEECLPGAADYATSSDAIHCQLVKLFKSKEEFFGYSWNKVYKREIVERYHLRFKEGLHIREDELFALDFCQHITSIRTMSFAPYNYRILCSSLSHDATVRFRDYRLLINEEKEIIQQYDDSEFKSAANARLFQYYLSSIIECVRLDKTEKFDVISEAIDCYHANKIHIRTPRWQSLAFGFPIKRIARLLVYMVFTLRNMKSL